MSRNPSWGSSEHMSSSSTAARPQPPMMSQPAVPAWDAQSQPPPWQSHAVAPKAAGHWDDATDNGADFFASSPLAPFQEPGGIVGDGLRPQQGQAVGSDSLETEPAAETLPAPQSSCAEQQGQEQPSPFAAGSVQQQEFPWEGPQVRCSISHSPKCADLYPTTPLDAKISSFSPERLNKLRATSASPAL